MFDVKIPDSIPFHRQILLSLTWGSAVGVGLGAGVTIVALIAHHFHLV